MRERWARGLALLTGLLVVLLSAGFAALQNPDLDPAAAEPRSPAPDAADPAQLARGEALFESEGCTRCHSIGGRGSRRSPLDGVGERLLRDELRDWIVAEEGVREDLPPGTIAAKRRYALLPEEDLEALGAYLASLGSND